MTEIRVARRRRTTAGAVTLGAVAGLIAATGLLAHKPASQRPAAAITCLNSYDPACGAFYWDPAPSTDSPIRVTVSAGSARAVAGEPLRFDAAATDPDARIACHWLLFGDEQTALAPAVTIRKPYGRWITPARSPGRFRLSVSHTYEKPGTYRATFGASSGDGCSPGTNPYGDESVAVTTVVVVPR